MNEWELKSSKVQASELPLAPRIKAVFIQIKEALCMQSEEFALLYYLQDLRSLIRHLTILDLGLLTR